MTRPLIGAAVPIADAELIEALQRSVGPRVARVERRPSAYRTSFALEEVDVHLGDGSVLPLVLKDLRPHALHHAARSAKPGFLYSPLREVAVYRSVLAAEELGTARLYGSAAEEEGESFWLLLEKVPGVELYQVGEVEVWREAARWLARLHLRLSATALEALAGQARLIRYDAAFYRTWIQRARAFRRAERGAGAVLDRLAERHDAVVEPLFALPVSLLHGEFYASNVLVQERGREAPRVCPVDWEMAALGPGLVDLAALVAGGWPEEEKTRIADAYRDEWAALAGPPLPVEHFQAGLDRARLHLAVQWLGWSDDWSPPREHAQDWLREARAMMERLSL